MPLIPETYLALAAALLLLECRLDFALALSLVGDSCLEDQLTTYI